MKIQNLPSCSRRSVFLDTDDVYESVVAAGAAPRTGVIIVDLDTRWIWDLFPIVLHWRLRGFPVSVVTEAPKPSKLQDESRRRLLLKGLGCEVAEAPIKQRLFVVDASINTDTVAFRFEREGDYVATRRTRSTDAAILNKIDVEIAGYNLTLGVTRPSPTILPASDDEIVGKLISASGPPAYQRIGVSMRMEQVPLANADSISMTVRAYRFRQIDHLISVFLKHRFALFEAASVKLCNGKRSLITPPVVEEKGGRFVFMEGNTRAFHALRNGRTSLRCLVVRGVIADLPAKPVPFDQVFMSRVKMPADRRQIDWDYTNFRKIEAAVHNY